MRTAYVNGAYVRQSEAVVSIEDRGYQFADAVYEVWSVFDGRLADLEGHLNRLERSLGELKIATPMPRNSLLVVLNEVVRRNRVREGMVYLQISRGVAPRDHVFPENVRPAMVVTARPVDRDAAAKKALTGIKAKSMPDIRWGRCDIKTVGLLPNVLAKQAAKEDGAGEVIFVDKNGYVTEGGSTNVYMVDADGIILTRDLKANILAGVTRLTLLDMVSDTGLEIRQVAFTLEAAKAASEVFITAATSLVMPIVAIDGHPVGEGKPGPVASALRDSYISHARRTASA
ncbi:D-alanine aminotransferase [Asticcacaulis biprosthecium C19]|uniref:Probable branched-chain-amino-acid aminotransferase n=1 Tax=Asticcacaulis biprosthecium C19 TaxID=715226 RepID=F4QQS2_9CAUL|nr:D-amino-acid transaminase [Asticcacaulis biprosthecium]EGF90559.1 D-alanine aminotransferase [Asticcacaulis biprosthecium C19]